MRNFMTTLGFDPVSGTIGANTLGDVAGPDRSSREPRPLRKCAYVIKGDDGRVVGTCGDTCGTILREGNRGCFCALHTKLKVKGEKYTRSEDERKARTAQKKIHLVRNEPDNT